MCTGKLDSEDEVLKVLVEVGGSQDYTKFSVGLLAHSCLAGVLGRRTADDDNVDDNHGGILWNLWPNIGRKAHIFP